MMSDETRDWTIRMETLANALGDVERALDAMEVTLPSVTRFAEQLRAGLLNEDVVNGLRAGLALLNGVVWLDDVREQHERLRSELVLIDTRVADGELPSTAHSWRHQFDERLAAFEQRRAALASQLDDARIDLARSISL